MPSIHIACVSDVTAAQIEALVSHRAALLVEVNPRDRLLVEDYRRWLHGPARRNDCVHWIVTDDRQVVGSASLTYWAWAPSTKPGATAGFLYNLYIEPNYRRCGIGTEMLSEIVRWAKARERSIT